jgi:dethiobiotin synthetase
LRQDFLFQSSLDVNPFLAQNKAMISIHPAGYFITGSDTDVGKTYIGCELIRQIRAHGIGLEVRKPAESGCATGESSILIAEDALKLGAANQNLETMERIAAYRFKAALAPPRAARLEGCQLRMESLIKACSLDDNSHLLIVEGAGGFYSPLAENGLNADLASALQLSVFIVVKDQIGAVNQALMTIQAVESRHLTIAAVILNQLEDSRETDMNNAEDLRQHCSSPIFSCLYRQPLELIFS